MIHYLSDIASRSTGSDDHTIMPVRTGFSYPDVTIANDLQSEAGSQDVGQEQVTGQIAAPDQSVQSPRLGQEDVEGRQDMRIRENPEKKSYFTRFIERVETIRETSRDPDQLQHPIGTEYVEPSIEVTDETPFVDGDTWEPTDNRMKIPGIVDFKNGPEKRKVETSGIRTGKKIILDESRAIRDQDFKPAVDSKNQDTTDSKKKDTILTSTEFLPFRQIIPNQPVIDDKALVYNKAQQELPGLVIGKITVEIVPPVVPPPVKTVTKVIQSAPATSSKSNNLRFGLGQL